ncbi:MAG: hypothetical protein K2N85_10990 [Lachnospiraceae bacterium]|nr:hypothetical protein [Lachnospiraceae bacterium]
MDGHECTEILFSQLNAECRIDAEYFYKANLKMQALIKSKSYVTIGEIGYVTDGIHTSIDYDENSRINLISATSPRQNVFNLTRNAYISEAAHLANPRTALKENDIILSTVGTIGNCAVVDADILPANTDRHVGIIRLHSTINPYVLSTFLLTKYGKNQTIRETTGNVQPNLFLYKVREIIIPVFESTFQKTIQKAVLKAKELLKKSELAYTDAEKLLETEIGIDMSAISNGGVSVKSFSESFGNTGRLDAEYYQPKYDDFNNHVLGYKNGYTTPSENFKLIKSKCSRELDSYPYVEIGDIDIGNGSVKYNIVPTQDLPANAKIMTKKGDLIVSTVRPYRGAVAILETNDLLVSGAFTVLRSNSLYPVQTLQVLFRTKLYKDWLLKFNVGTSYPVIKDDDVLNIPIPIFKNEIHEKITEYVINSQEIHSRSKELLDCAKTAVEMAIEQNEAAAIIWLESRIQELTK